jgi:hypothetical protein
LSQDALGYAPHSPSVLLSVRLDDPHPGGSTGMTEAVLALSYDPAMLTLAPEDISLGSIPGAAAGWWIHSVIDQTAGLIGIQLYSTTPFAGHQAGSLVTIAFHLHPGEPGGVSPRSPGAGDGPTTVQLLGSAIINNEQFVTQVDDDQGQYVLSPGIDRVVLDLGPDPGARAGQSHGVNPPQKRVPIARPARKHNDVD